MISISKSRLSILKNKLFCSFYSIHVFLQTLLIKSRKKKYIDIIRPKDRWTNKIFSKINQILGIKPRFF